MSKKKLFQIAYGRYLRSGRQHEFTDTDWMGLQREALAYLKATEPLAEAHFAMPDRLDLVAPRYVTKVTSGGLRYSYPEGADLTIRGTDTVAWRNYAEIFRG